MTTGQHCAAALLSALGGIDNIEQIDPCTTRLRSVVKDAALVDVARLHAAGVFGVMISGRLVQVVIGPHADNVASGIADIIG